MYSSHKLLFLVLFRNSIASRNLINVLNKRALVSLKTNDITEEKVRLNVAKNPHTTFLTFENATSDLINNLVIKILFSNSRKLATVCNSQKLEMDIYKSMLLVITENRFVTSHFLSNFSLSLLSLFHF